MDDDGGQVLDALEQRYDGPIPPALRRQALAGGRLTARRRDALARSAFLDRLAGQIVAIRAAPRRNGEPADSLSGALDRCRRAALD